MTSLLEKFISVIAPHRCIMCSKENNVLCAMCMAELFADVYEGCYMCGLPTIDARPCAACQKQTPVSHTWVAGTYEAEVRDLIRKYKFSRVRAAYGPLAAVLDTALPYFAQEVLVVPVPTVPRHIRIRGYDHAALLAKELARRRGWRFVPALQRRHSLRQVGASKAVRIKQANSAFLLAKPQQLAGRTVLLVDDVTTSGATITAAARCLREARPAEVCAAVIAKHTLS